MKYLRYKEEDKDRVLQALDHLRSNDLFMCVVESLLKPTLEEASRGVENTAASNDEHQPLQGVARVMRELVTICRDAHVRRGRQKMR